ncbi:TPA: hypothetical protein ACTZ5N_000129 [Bacillus cereus]
MAEFNEILPVWQANGKEPPLSKVVDGWKQDERPPADYMNHLHNRTFESIRELQTYALHKDGEEIANISEDIKELTNIKSQKTIKDFAFYVSPNGDDNNSGLASNEPFKTIQKAINSLPDVIQHHTTIYLADGTYTDNQTAFDGANIDIYNTTGTTSCVAYVTDKNVKESGSILIYGNPTNKDAVIIDGQNTREKCIFVMDVKRINIKGVTCKNATFSNIQYKRGASGQLKNVVSDGSQYGIWGYQYTFIEFQGDVLVKNATAYGIMMQIHTYFNAIGLTLQNNAAGLNVTDHTKCFFPNTCTFNATGDAFNIDPSSYASINSGTFIGCKIGSVNGGRIKLTSPIVTFSPVDGLLMLRKGSVAEIHDPIFSSGATPSSVSGIGIQVLEGSVLYVLNGYIDGFYKGISITEASRAFIEGTDLRNSRFDGVSVTRATVSLKNVVSTVQNGRYGIENRSGVVHDGGGNTISGVTRQLGAIGAIWETRTGPTASRPTTFIDVGAPYYDTTLWKTVRYSGSGNVWRDETGVIA